jgi:hypothetical protein
MHSKRSPRCLWHLGGHRRWFLQLGDTTSHQLYQARREADGSNPSPTWFQQKRTPYIALFVVAMKVAMICPEEFSNVCSAQPVFRC